MANVAYDAVTEAATQSSVNSRNWTHTTGAISLPGIVVTLQFSTDPGTVTVTCGGVSVPGTKSTGGGDNLYTWMGVLKGQATGSNSIACSFTNTVNRVSGVSISFANVDSFGTIQTATMNSASPSITVPSMTGAMVVDNWNCAWGTASTCGQTQRVNVFDTNIARWVSTASGSASVVMSWTRSANWEVACAVSVNPVPASAGQNNKGSWVG